MSEHRQCPCCGYYTLDSRGDNDLCPVCFWEDDDQTEQWGQPVQDRALGPNPVQLREARMNYKNFGASAERRKPHVRPPRPDEGADQPRSPQDLLDNLLALCPEFSKTWEDESYLWTRDDGTFTECGVFAAFSHYIADILTNIEAPRLAEVFEYVERCMHGNEQVSTAAATCFLENLMNRTPEEIDPQRFVPLLGPDSKDYCQAWDEFRGLQTAGLW
jgi:hypothetical protein